MPSLRDLPALADVVEALEEAIKAQELICYLKPEGVDHALVTNDLSNSRAALAALERVEWEHLWHFDGKWTKSSGAGSVYAVLPLTTEDEE